MHGRERKEYKAKFSDPKISAALAQKALQWNALSKELLIRRKRLSPPSVATSTDEGKVGSSKVTGSAAETLKIIDKVLVVNPDPSHLWNHRRELLLQTNNDCDNDNDNFTEGTSLAAPSFQIREELDLTAACLKRNPKAYSAWYHRKWSIRHWISLGCPEKGGKAEKGAAAAKVLKHELGLCAEFLSLDERNFHCWNYRRFVVAAIAATVDSKDDDEAEESSPSLALDGSWSWTAINNATDKGTSSKLEILMGPQLAAPKKSDEENAPSSHSHPYLSDEKRNILLSTEWDFTKEKIMNNFSNCSAFHYRSKLLPLELNRRVRENLGSDVADTSSPEVYEEKLDLAREELELVQNAIFTEPDDQTAWWYHRFVVTWAAPTAVFGAGTDRSEHMEEDSKSAVIQSYLEILQDEAASVRELIATEEEGGSGCKWGLLALHMILENLIKVDSLLGDDKDEEDEEEEMLVEEANECLEKLIELDPDRATRYESMKQ